MKLTKPCSVSRAWLIAAFLCFASISARATIFYVSPTGSDSNSGTQAAPFRQIRAALTVVHPGDTVTVADGSYLGFDVSDLHGNAGQPITIQATGTGANVTTTTDRSDNRDTIFVTFSSYIVLDGLRSFSANRAAIRIDNSQNITVRNGVYGNNATWGIFTDFSDNLLIQRNECYGSMTQHGIYVSNSCTGPVVSHNVVHDNFAAGIHMNGDLSQGPPGLITQALVEGNVIYNNGVGGGSGINMDGVQNSVVRNNLLYNNHASGIAMFQIDGASGPSGNQVLNNTIDIAADARWALLIGQSAGLNTVRNNILDDRNPSHGGLLLKSPDDVPNVDSDYNVMDYVSTDDGDTRLTLAQWRTLGHDAHSLSAAPGSLFVNPAGGDYHELALSPTIDAGVTLTAVPVDLDGNIRPMGASTDIGCYEFVSGLTLLSVSAAPSSVPGGSITTGTVSLSATAVSDVVVSLSSNSASAKVPVSVTVPAGKMSATFNIATTAVTAYVTATVTATFASMSRSAALVVFPPGLFDLNGDGKIDLLFQNAKTGVIAYWTMDGINELTSGLIYPSDPGGADWKVVGTGDFNGDGKPDILFQNQRTGQLIYWLMNGTALIRYGSITPDNPGSLDWQVVAVADFNGDGKVDILFQRQSTGQLVCWLMNGTTLLRYVLLPDTGSPLWRVAGAADFNHDGMPDLLFQNQQTGQLVYWLMDGTSILTVGLVNPSAPGLIEWKVVGISDFNGDGNPDLLFQNQKTGDLVYWLMNGATMVNFGYLNPGNPGLPEWRVAAPH